jgi:hypothetical protein
MPGVTGSTTCPAGGNPSTTAGKQRYRRGGSPLPALRRRLAGAGFRSAQPPGTATGRRSIGAPARGEAGILTAIGWNPTQIVAFCPYIKAPADIMMMAAPNTDREDVHSF